MSYDGPERRKATLTERDLQSLASMIHPSVEDHRSHHQWIDAQIKVERRRAEFWGGMRDHVARWGAVSVLTILLYLLWQGVKHYVRLP